MLHTTFCCYCSLYLCSSVLVFRLFFFFQAEDGIRDLTVTGVQTCALPISLAADEAHLDLLEPLRVRAAQLRVAIVALRPDREDGDAQVVVGRAGTQELAQVVALRREETGVERTVRRESRARALRAERLRDR